jgi:FkbM family methyltransferase
MRYIPPPTYYSQIGQDEYVDCNIFKGLRNGVCVDIGATDGVFKNNTYHFYKHKNWTSINIEPRTSEYDKLIRNRLMDNNYNVAIDKTKSSKPFLWVDNDSRGVLSGIQEYVDMNRIRHECKNDNVKIINVPTIPLHNIFDELHTTHVNYMSIDVEGAEQQVVDTINFENIFIDVIVIEHNNQINRFQPVLEKLESKGFIKILVLQFDFIFIHKDSQFLKNIDSSVIYYKDNKECRDHHHNYWYESIGNKRVDAKII